MKILLDIIECFIQEQIFPMLFDFQSFLKNLPNNLQVFLVIIIVVIVILCLLAVLKWLAYKKADAYYKGVYFKSYNPDC
jgi:uncharacterized membrane protein YdbT with pleckstrin-like domain